MESVIVNQARIYFSAILDVCISAFRKDYNNQSILLKAVEDWTMTLDEGKYVGAILMDLNKHLMLSPMACSLPIFMLMIVMKMFNI